MEKFCNLGLICKIEMFLIRADPIKNYGWAEQYAIKI